MVRILLLILLVWLIFWIGKRFIAFLNENPAKETLTSNEKMVKCANCDTYIPESESMTIDNRIICKHQPCKK
ncbi:MAG: PP0621 family protein [Methylophilus sp.]